ncbi:MAG: hypothetical protein E4H20_06595 [Spirochaetales bacterium]|nr:MAG: hypothetical protein E4H20_06595 [Spirochaetales bacterium]
MFTSVLCPTCGFSAEPSRFRDGCPVCGHSGFFDAPGYEDPVLTSAVRTPAPPVPWWMWLVAVAILGIAVVALAGAIFR